MQNHKKKIFNQGYIFIIRSKKYIKKFHNYVERYRVERPIIAEVDMNYDFTKS